MPETPSPRQILSTLLPHLRAAAGYASYIQSKITALPAKEEGDNFFAAALTDADLSIQNLVEVVLLGTFPEIRFYGEEHESSRNTKYFRSLALGEPGDYLVTLDPIDGTQFYLDGHNNYQIILSVLNHDDFEGVLAISPATKEYFYALRGQGAFQGPLEADLQDCTPLQITDTKPVILLSWGMSHLRTALEKDYQIIDVKSSYSQEEKIPNVNGILGGEVRAAILKQGKFIDGGALAFLAREAGCIVTTLQGDPLPPLNQCGNYSLPGLIIAASQEIHQQIIQAVQQL